MKASAHRDTPPNTPHHDDDDEPWVLTREPLARDENPFLSVRSPANTAQIDPGALSTAENAPDKADSYTDIERAYRSRRPEDDEPRFLTPSPGLTPRQQAVFTSVVHSFPPDHFKEADRFMLEAFTRVVALNEAMAARLEQCGAFDVELGLQGTKKSEIDLFTKTAVTLSSLATRLRASPSSRANTPAAEEELKRKRRGALSPLEALGRLHKQFNTMTQEDAEDDDVNEALDQ